MLNFSIAYGKTAHGLAKDFGTGLQEAKETVERWYGDRSEVTQGFARGQVSHVALAPKTLISPC